MTVTSATISDIKDDTAIKGDNTTSDDTLSLRGTYSTDGASTDNLYVWGSFNGGPFVRLDGQAVLKAQNGTWTYTSPDLADGTWRFQLSSSGTNFSNASRLGSPTEAWTIDTVAPVVSNVTVAENDIVDSGEEKSFSVTGEVTGAEGRVVTVQLVNGNGEVVGTATGTVTNGLFSVSYSGLTLPAGTNYSVRVTTTDLAGNQAVHSESFTSVACFVRGTLIKTPRGEVPVEALTLGDEVITVDGRAHPIKWIGRRSYSTMFVSKSSQVVPVLIRAGALGGGVPYRDLRLSPEHALYIDGVLVPAVHLVNGTTIIRELRGRTIEYFHIELQEQEIILAEGAPAETYVNHDSRKMFENWREYVALYGEDQPAVTADGEFARVYECVTAGPKLESIRGQLNRVGKTPMSYAA